MPSSSKVFRPLPHRQPLLLPVGLSSVPAIHTYMTMSPEILHHLFAVQLLEGTLWRWRSWTACSSQSSTAKST